MEKIFNFFQLKNFLRSLSFSLSVCGYRKKFPSIFPFCLVLNDNWISERLKWQARKLRVSLRSSFSQEMILFLRGEKVPSTNNFIRFSDFHFFSRGGESRDFVALFLTYCQLFLKFFSFSLSHQSFVELKAHWCQGITLTVTLSVHDPQPV